MVGRAAMVGEQQQAERDLRDDQGLREREQLRDAVARAAGAGATKAATDASTQTAITRNAFMWWAVSIEATNLPRGRP